MIVYLLCLYALSFVFMFYANSELYALFCSLCFHFVLLFELLLVENFTVLVAPFLPKQSVFWFLILNWVLLVVANGSLFRTMYRRREKWTDAATNAMKQKYKMALVASVAILHALLLARNMRNNLQVLLLAMLIGINLYSCVLTSIISRNMKVETTFDQDFLETNMFYWK
jgi:divalent metal cation (Fe/Co/Zn/Cd) transporter